MLWVLLSLSLFSLCSSFSCYGISCPHKLPVRDVRYVTYVTWVLFVMLYHVHFFMFCSPLSHSCALSFLAMGSALPLSLLLVLFFPLLWYLVPSQVACQGCKIHDLCHVRSFSVMLCHMRFLCSAISSLTLVLSLPLLQVLLSLSFFSLCSPSSLTPSVMVSRAFVGYLPLYLHPACQGCKIRDLCHVCSFSVMLWYVRFLCSALPSLTLVLSLPLLWVLFSLSLFFLCSPPFPPSLCYGISCPRRLPPSLSSPCPSIMVSRALIGCLPLSLHPVLSLPVMVSRAFISCLTLSFFPVLSLPLLQYLVLSQIASLFFFSLCSPSPCYGISCLHPYYGILCPHRLPVRGIRYVTYAIPSLSLMNPNYVKSVYNLLRGIIQDLSNFVI